MPLADWTSLYWPPRQWHLGGSGGRAVYTSSKLLCWVARPGRPRRRACSPPGSGSGRWRNALGRGSSTGAGMRASAPSPVRRSPTTWTPACSSPPRVGLLPPTDERGHGDDPGIEAELTDGGLVRRWTGAEDGRSSCARSGWPSATPGPGRSPAGGFRGGRRVCHDLGLPPRWPTRRPGAGRQLPAGPVPRRPRHRRTPSTGRSTTSGRSPTTSSATPRRTDMPH